MAGGGGGGRGGAAVCPADLSGRPGQLQEGGAGSRDRGQVERGTGGGGYFRQGGL